MIVILLIELSWFNFEIGKNVPERNKLPKFFDFFK